jgi:hypothetical protein
MKQQNYIETSVVSYLTSRLSKDIVIAGHQSATHDFWDRLPEHDLYISELVLQEASRGDEAIAATRLAALAGIAELEIDDDCRALAKTLVADGAVPASYPEDALHIATAAVHGINVKGSHHIFRHPIKPGHISVPHPKMDLGVGLVQKLLRQAGLK